MPDVATPRAARRGPSWPGRRSAPAVASTLAALGLLVVAVVSFVVLFGRFDLVPGGNGPNGPQRTPNPSVVFTPSPPPDTGYHWHGSILFAKSGDIWALNGTQVKRLTTTGRTSSPTWSPDGRFIYFIETRLKNARGPLEEASAPYLLTYPVVMRMNADGTNPTTIKDSLIAYPGNRYFFNWYLQPDVSPDGKTIALVTDAPNPFQHDIVLGFLPTSGGTATVPRLPEFPPLGHSDPAWSPDGTQVAFTYNQRSGAIGNPRIAIYSLVTKKMRILSGPGYARPAWSPDARFIAAERTDGKGRDLVVLSAKDGSEVAHLTNDGASFAPTWSPDGTSIAFLHAQGLGIDLQLVALGNPLAVTQVLDLTTASLLDGASRAAWFIPPDQLRTPSPTPRPTAASAAPS